MNDLPWIKYEPKRMFMDLIGMSAWGKVAHVALFNYTLINDGPPLNENEALRDITGCPPADWGRVKRELIGKGWLESSNFFLHRGTIKTLNESKETFIENQNRTASANKKTTRYELLPPDPETGCVTYRVTEHVTPSVTSPVTPVHKHKHKQEQEQPDNNSLSSKLSSGDSKGGQRDVASHREPPRANGDKSKVQSPATIPRFHDSTKLGYPNLGSVVQHIVANKDGWDYDNSKVKAKDFTPGGLKTVLQEFVGKVSVGQAQRAWREAALITHQAVVDGMANAVANPAAYCISTFKNWLKAFAAGLDKPEPKDE